MDRRVRVWIAGSLAAAFSIASSALNVVFAYNVSNRPVLSALRVLLFVAFIISLLNLANLAYFCVLYASNLNRHSLGLKRRTWMIYSIGMTASAVSCIVSGVTLVWLVIRRSNLPQEVLHASPMTLLGIWFATWGVSGIGQIMLFYWLGMWTKLVLKDQRASRLDMDFGIRASMHESRRSSLHHTHPSFGSEDVTLNSPPRTPVSRGGSTTRRSSSTKAGPGSSRTKLIRPSTRSSIDGMPFPAGEAMSIDSAFDDWDTSSVHREIRYAINSSPPTTRAGLEPIPGSRPDSPNDTVDDSYLPESPIASSPPHAATSDSATVVGWSSSPRQPKSSPPSSPPNFSRPTSRPGSSHKTNQPPPPSPPRFQPFGHSMQDLIHPLFRPNSPHPPPIATAGTMVTASPMADYLITPRTLEKLRGDSPAGIHKLKASPSIDRVETMSTIESVPDSPTLGSDDLGSPGPSIVDEAELPPILPGFVLSAGSRSSLVDYGKRKSMKKQHKSRLSTGSQVLG